MVLTCTSSVDKLNRCNGDNKANPSSLDIREQIIEKYDISEAGITDNDELSSKLPGYCRDLCDNVSK